MTENKEKRVILNVKLFFQPNNRKNCDKNLKI